MILFINACVRKDSRTKRLADAFLATKKDPVTELRLAEVDFPVTDEAFLSRRDELADNGAFDDSAFCLARQFAAADEIVIAAPTWDLSFPAALKQYFEQINVVGVTFRYLSDGTAEGLCKAEKLTYITTAGGEYFPEEYGFGYVKALSRTFYGINNVELIKATGLDIYGNDPEAIIDEVIKKYNLEDKKNEKR
ncbi:MAG: NAD(P)H-dependent oxidoreductase [Clostridia bacterium]|nr:NAD(P)H-dependent oxidoreductase [Clostridia bacterium]